MSVYPAESVEGTLPSGLQMGKRPWDFESVVDWFETEGAVFTTLGGRDRPNRMRVVVASQQENRIIKSLCEYLRRFGFHPIFRPTSYIIKKGMVRTRTAECELLRNLEQFCFLKQCLPLLRTEKRIRAVKEAMVWLQERMNLPHRGFRRFECSKLE